MLTPWAAVEGNFLPETSSEGTRALASEILGPKPLEVTPQQAPGAVAEGRGDILETSVPTQSYLN